MIFIFVKYIAISRFIYFNTIRLITLRLKAEVWNDKSYRTLRVSSEYERK